MPYKEGKTMVTGDPRFHKYGTGRLLASLHGKLSPLRASARNVAGILSGPRWLRTKRGYVESVAQ